MRAAASVLDTGFSRHCIFSFVYPIKRVKQISVQYIAEWCPAVAAFVDMADSSARKKFNQTLSDYNSSTVSFTEQKHTKTV